MLISSATAITFRWGNLSENPKALLFLVDYSQQQRVKIWGQARIIEDDADPITFDGL